MHGREDPTPEFSRPVSAEDVGAQGIELEISATEDERRKLARRFDLDVLDRFDGRARLTALGDGRVRLDVTFEADMLQSCVITLEPVASHVAERFEVVYAPVPPAEGETEVFVDVSSEDPPEALIEGKIDIGEMMAQHLALHIDPYPRASDAAAADLAAEDGAGAEAASGPFEKLRQWRSRA